MKVDVYIHVFFTSVLVGGEWSDSRPGRFTPRERVPGTHWIGDWVTPRAGLDDVEKTKFLTLLGLELRNLCRPARSQSLYCCDKDLCLESVTHTVVFCIIIRMIKSRRMR
jgi:hypothetical protein